MPHKNHRPSSESTQPSVAQTNDEVHFLAKALDYYRSVERWVYARRFHYFVL